MTVKCGNTAVVAGQLCENVTRYPDAACVALVVYFGVEEKARAKCAAAMNRAEIVFTVMRQMKST